MFEQHGELAIGRHAAPRDASHEAPDALERTAAVAAHVAVHTSLADGGPPDGNPVSLHVAPPGSSTYHRPVDTVRTILLTTDFSETSARAVPAARGLAACYGSGLHLLHVEDDRVSPLVVEYMAVGLEALRERQVEHARTQLEAFAARHLGPGVAVELEVVLGVPHLEIVRVAVERQVDLIVMATHGRGFFSHAIMGSTTERVLRRAPCPVLVVRG